MNKTIAFLIILIPLAGSYVLFRPAMIRSDLRQVKAGMKKQEVLEILGNPREESANASYYWRWGNAGYVTISFDHSNRVMEVNDESVFR